MTEKPVSILYVEDNFDNRVLVRRVLEAEGYQVFEASTANKAFEELEKQLDTKVLPGCDRLRQDES